MGNLTPLQEI